MIHRFDGGPVGLDNIAASIGEERDTIEDVIEPYLIQQGFLQRTPTRAHGHAGGVQAPGCDTAQILWRQVLMRFYHLRFAGSIELGLRAGG